jgi:hypothetical protein
MASQKLIIEYYLEYVGNVHIYRSKLLILVSI